MQELEKPDSRRNDSSELVVEPLSAEYKDPSVPQLQTSTTDSNCDEEQKSFLELEAEFLTAKTELESQLAKTKTELLDCEERCRKQEQQVSILTIDLEKKSRYIEELSDVVEKLKQERQDLLEKNDQISILKNEILKRENEYEDMEKKVRDNEDLRTEIRRMESEFSKKQQSDIEENRKREERVEKMNKALVKERIDAQLKCEELTRNLQQTKEELESERLKSNGLSRDLEDQVKLRSQLQEKISELDRSLQKITWEQKEKLEKMTQLTSVNQKLQAELEMVKREKETADKSSAPLEMSILRDRSGKFVAIEFRISL